MKDSRWFRSLEFYLISKGYKLTFHKPNELAREFQKPTQALIKEDFRPREDRNKRGKREKEEKEKKEKGRRRKARKLCLS